MNKKLFAALTIVSDIITRNIEANNIETEDTVNKQGIPAYSIDDMTKLVSMLNTLKMAKQYYRSEEDILIDLYNIVDTVGKADPLFLAQAIVYSRCMGTGMRTINHIAAAMAAPYISGLDFAKRFYGSFDKIGSKNGSHHGGCIYRPDDMMHIKNYYNIIYKNGTLSNAMKKGFKTAIESFDNYQCAKYQKAVRDIINLVHPKNAMAQDVINKIMSDENVIADTWETKNTAAGHAVASLVDNGIITQDEADIVKAEVINNNWEELLTNNKLGVLAAIRNIRNIMTTPRKSVINKWCKLITTPGKIRESLIHPIQINLAYNTVHDEYSYTMYTHQVLNALQTTLELSLPNLTDTLKGKTCIIQDCSGSMSAPISYNSTIACSNQAALITAIFAKATNADIIQFGSNANYISNNAYDYDSVFEFANSIKNDSMGCTYASSAFDLMIKNNAKYDRIIFISDNELNGRVHMSTCFKSYIEKVCSPYIYSIDLCAYGTKPFKSDKVQYYCGFGFEMFEDIAKNEFDPNMHIDKIKQIII